MKSAGWARPHSRRRALHDEKSRTVHAAGPKGIRAAAMARLLTWLLLAVAPSAALAQGEPTQLHEAALANDAAAVARLVAQGASIDARDSRGLTPLHWAASHDARETVEALVVQGAETDAKDGDGRTPLHVALGAKAWETAEWLVAQDADIDAASDRGETALHRKTVCPSAAGSC